MENTQRISIALDILDEAKQDIAGVLENDHSVLLIVESGLTRLINRLSAMIGKSAHIGAIVEHPPITDFMGEKIEYAKQIDVAVLTPLEADKQHFRQRVNELYDQFDSISPEGLVQNATIPEEQIFIRGVAKKAGVEGYEDREITVEFIEEIAAAIKQQAADAAQQAAIDKQLADPEASTKGRKPAKGNQ